MGLKPEKEDQWAELEKIPKVSSWEPSASKTLKRKRQIKYLMDSIPKNYKMYYKSWKDWLLVANQSL